MSLKNVKVSKFDQIEFYPLTQLNSAYIAIAEVPSNSNTFRTMLSINKGKDWNILSPPSVK